MQIKNTGTGCFPKDLRGEVLKEAKDRFYEDFYAPSNRATMAARWRTIVKMLDLQGLGPFPPSVARIHALGIALKHGQYKSASNYLGHYKVECERRGFAMDSLMQRAIKDATRSCVRGLGGPTRAMALPFDQLRLLPGGRAAWSDGGPLCPRNFLVLGSWFLMREVEAAHTLARHVKVQLDALQKPRVEWHLPVSKTDQEAVGAVRVHGCSCTTAVDLMCPGHAAWDHLTFLMKKFGKGDGQKRKLPEVAIQHRLPNSRCLFRLFGARPSVWVLSVRRGVSVSDGFLGAKRLYCCRTCLCSPTRTARSAPRRRWWIR